jgi:hypothetical protein
MSRIISDIVCWAITEDSLIVVIYGLLLTSIIVTLKMKLRESTEQSCGPVAALAAESKGCSFSFVMWHIRNGVSVNVATLKY